MTVADAGLRQEDFLERLPLAACVCDRTGAIVQYNRGAAELWRSEAQRGEKFCTAVRLLDATAPALGGTRTLAAGKIAREMRRWSSVAG